VRNATEKLAPATEAASSLTPVRRRKGAVAALLATALAGGLMAFSPVASAAPATADSVASRPGERLSDREADRVLDRAGVRRLSPGDCHNVNRSRCTSYQGIQEDTVRGLVKLKRDSRCQVVVVNGTEVGNDRDSRRSRYSHANGHKVDLRENRCLNSYIRRTADRVRGTRDVVYRDNERGRPYVQYEFERGVLDVTYF
jgi:hypothetical protein